MNDKNPLVSVVILPCDGAPFEASLDSALAQTFPSLEVIVVGTLPEDGRPSPANVQFCGNVDSADAWNFAANRAVGEYLCFLPAGEVLPSAYIEKCVFIAESGGYGRWKSARLRLDALVSDHPPIHAPVVRKATLLKMGSELLAKHAAAVEAEGTPVQLDSGVQFSYANLIAGASEHQSTILLAMPFLTMGGAEAIISQICGQLKALGFRLLVVTTSPAVESQGDTSAWFEDSAAGIYHLPQFLDVALWPAFICYLIQQHSVDVIWQVGSTVVYDLLPQLRKLFPGIPVVDQLFNPVGHTANHLRRRHLIDRVVIEHAGMRDWLLEHGETEERIALIPNGVNLEWFAPQPRVDWRTRQLRPAGDGRFVVGFIGRLSNEKGPDVFLDIACQLADRPEIEFLLCGAGPMEAQLRARISAQELSAPVHLLGFIPSRGGHLSCCDVVVVCSRLDGRPNLVMESLAMGIPVVASRVGGIPEMIPEGSGGMIREPGDAPGFASAIRELADNPDRYRGYCAAARRHAEENFSCAESGKRYAGVFEEAGKLRAGLSIQISATSVAAALGLPSVGARSIRRSRLRIAWRILCLLLSPSRLTATWRNALLYRGLKRKTVAHHSTITDYFDRAFYLRMNPDVSRSGIPPLLHYVFRGFLEGRDPSPRFNSAKYMALFPEVERSGLNPLLHYLTSGKSEDRPLSE